MAVRMTISADPRVDAYAKLLVERCLDVQPGMQVLIRTTHLATPAVLALQREIARRGAHPILRIGFVMWPTNPAWAAEAPEELLDELSEIDRFASDHMDARITMDAPENTHDGTELSPERFRLVKQAEHHFYRPHDGGRDPVGELRVPHRRARAGRRADARAVRGRPLRRLPDRLGRAG